MNGIELIRHIHNTLFTWTHFLIVYIFLFIADNLLLIITKKLKPSTKYYRFHKKYGLMKITLFKILFISSDMYILSSNSVTGAFTIGLQMWYATIIIFALRDLLKKDVATKYKTS